jgi:hypothetical protein
MATLGRAARIQWREKARNALPRDEHDYINKPPTMHWDRLERLLVNYWTAERAVLEQVRVVGSDHRQAGRVQWSWRWRSTSSTTPPASPLHLRSPKQGLTQLRSPNRRRRSASSIISPGRARTPIAERRAALAAGSSGSAGRRGRAMTLNSRDVVCAPQDSDSGGASCVVARHAVADSRTAISRETAMPAPIEAAHVTAAGHVTPRSAGPRGGGS